MAQVLIVEDEPSISMVLQEVLEDEGFDAIAVSDGLEALQRLKQEPTPDIVLVDLFMPRVSGKEIVAAMRSSSALRNIPVVLVTGAVPSVHDFPPADSYQAVVGKPFDVIDVLDKVNDLLGKTA